MRAVLGALAVLAGLALAAPAPAQATQIASGVLPLADGSGFAWQVRVVRNDIQGIPGLCFELDHSWDAEGGSFGNISGGCVAGRVGRRFSLRSGSCRGIAVALGTGSIGDRRIRKLGLSLPRRARRARITFPGGEKVAVRAVRAPKALGLPVRLAWHVDAGEAGPTRVVALNRKGRTVGRWVPGRGC